MRTYRFSIEGKTPLFMHKDDVLQADMLSEWRKDPINKNVGVPGDDRSPAWTWHTYLYHDNNVVVMPHENVMVALRQAGQSMKIKGNKSLKVVTQTGMMIGSVNCDFLIGGKPIPMNEINKLRDLEFSKQAAGVKKLGFTLDVRRAKLNNSKHVRVRPRFEAGWVVSGTVEVWAPELTTDVIKRLFELAGQSGLGDWRPSSPKSPGPYGRWQEATVTPV